MDPTNNQLNPSVDAAKNVTLVPTVSQPSNIQTAQKAVVCNVHQEIEKLSKQINELLEKAPKDDPEYKNSSKKLIEIKKFLEKKTESPGNLKSKLFPRKKKVIMAANDGTYGEVEIEATPSEFLADPIPLPQDLVNMNLDDSILHAVDDFISAFKIVGNFFKK